MIMPLPFLSGCDSLKFYTYLTIAEKVVDERDNAIAFLYPNPKKNMLIDITIPQPPVPAQLVRTSMIKTAKNPAYSIGRSGNRLLCSQTISEEQNSNGT